MKAKSILFTPDNIRSIRDKKTKWQTRRIIKPQPELDKNVGFIWKGKAYGRGLHENDQDGQAARNFIHKCPYGKIGDRLYIKEGVITHVSIPQLIGYYMDGCRATEPWMKRVTAMFMAKRYARTWLELTDVRVERLQDISEEDAIAEGIQPIREGTTHLWKNYGPSMNEPDWFPDPRKSYQSLWDSINLKKHHWKNNDWIWALSFRLIEN